MGKSAARCSKCGIDLTLEFEEQERFTIGEMAHVIARKTNGPRGSENFPKDKLDTYENLILLCPTHHSMIDKAPKKFTVDEILGWKKEHETRVNALLSGGWFDDKEDLFNATKNILLENIRIVNFCGPNSMVAKTNPLSNVSELWALKKEFNIIPNNTTIINNFERNIKYLDDKEKIIFHDFKVHAEMFKENNKFRMDAEAIPLFPIEFQNMVFGGDIFKTQYSHKLRKDSKDFFENAIKRHNKVKELTQISNNYYLIKRINGKDVNVLVNNIYTLGLADYYEIVNTYGSIDAIVIMSNWNGYTTQAKSIARKENIAILGFTEFLGAMNYDNINKYTS